MTIRAHPVTAAVGAEVTGVDLANVNAAEVDELRRLWLEHKVLFFRDQPVSRDQHFAFGRRFGDLEVHPFTRDVDDLPEIVVLESTPEEPAAADLWHSDVTWRAEPSMGSILRAVEIPPAGGDTVFANAAMAYERLSDEWKSRVDDLNAVHDYVRAFGRGRTEAELADLSAQYPPARHPVIRTHPETGERLIYTNRIFVSHIEGMSAEESREILFKLERAISDPSVQCRFRWEVDSFAMWDNRCTQHYATNDYWPAPRRVERVTMIGDRPY